GDGPKILIVHTHGSEAYTPETGSAYQPLENYRTLQTERSVIRVGQVLAQTLEDAGISVIHDTAVNDYPSYNDSYWTTLAKVEQWQQQ
ncbi:MAG: stage II sporulation protein P, partial [Firmicutes bacterium]|nr:stage II sporulation protein P [Bacillota bacterium]